MDLNVDFELCHSSRFGNLVLSLIAKFDISMNCFYEFFVYCCTGTILETAISAFSLTIP